MTTGRAEGPGKRPSITTLLIGFLQYFIRMNNTFSKSSTQKKCIGIILGLAASLHTTCANSQENTTATAVQTLQIEKRINPYHETYILGPGDAVEIELVDVPELSGEFSIGPDGTLYLPRLRALYVEGLTVDELQASLTDQFKAYVIEPQVFVRPVAYKPIRVYVGGEVKRPGYYTLSGNQNTLYSSEEHQLHDIQTTPNTKHSTQIAFSSHKQSSLKLNRARFTVFPTVFDAIQSAQGITPYSNLAKVKVTRRRSISQGGGRVRTTLNFLSLITDGDESQNIRLLNGDVINVSKSPKVLREQLIQAGRTNLTPEYMQVYVTGRVQETGEVILPQGSSLVHAIDLAGGPKVLHGRVEFIRFTRTGEVDRRIFGLNSKVPSGDYRNPVLMSGDVIRIRETPLTKSMSVLDEITTPMVGIYSLYSIFNNQ